MGLFSLKVNPLFVAYLWIKRKACRENGLFPAYFAFFMLSKLRSHGQKEKHALTHCAVFI